MGMPTARNDQHVRGTKMRAKHLIAVAALVGGVLANLGHAYAGPTTGKYMFNKPPGNQGPSKTYDSTPPRGWDGDSDRGEWR